MTNHLERASSSVSQLAQFWENAQETTFTPTESPKLQTSAHLEKALTEWLKYAAPRENRLLAKQRILDAYDTQADTLTLNGLALQCLPECFSALSHLSTLKAAHNELSVLPSSIGDLKNLKHLDLYDNQLQQLPEGFEQLSNLETLDLRQNKFTKPPQAAQTLGQLRELNLGDNPLEPSAEVPAESILSGPASVDTSTSRTNARFSSKQSNTLSGAMKYEDLGLLDLDNHLAPPKTEQTQTPAPCIHNPMDFKQAVSASLLYLHSTSPTVIRLKGPTFQIQQKSSNLLRKLHVLGPKWTDLKQKLIILHGERAEAPYFAHNELCALVQSLPHKHAIRTQIVNNDQNQRRLSQAMQTQLQQ